MTGTALLNAIKDELVQDASERGIVLADCFKTPADFRQFVISFTMKQLVGMGKSVKEAYEIVFGEGSYSELVSSIYHDLRKSA